MKKFILRLFASTALLAPNLTLAAFETKKLTTTIENEGQLYSKITTFTNWVFSFLLIIAVIMVVLSAFSFLTASGNSEKLQKAKKLLIYAIIAVIIAVSAQTIVRLSAAIANKSIDF